MAAPLKDSLDYIPVDCDFFFDQKIKGLKVEFKSDGVLAYLYLLATAGRTKGYYAEFNKFTILDIADYFHITKEEASSILDFILEDSLLFDKTLFDKYSILTSKSQQRRFQKAKRTVGAKRVVKVHSKYWLLSKEETEPYIELCDDIIILEQDEINGDKSEKALLTEENNVYIMDTKRIQDVSIMDTKRIQDVSIMDTQVRLELGKDSSELGKSKKSKTPKPPKKNYADDVTLTDEEYNKLVSEHSKPFVDKCIDVLNNYKLSSGKKYKSDYHTILNWVVEKVAKEHPDLAKQEAMPDNSFFDTNPWGDISE